MQKSYSLYIHIPYCISKCSYCDFFSKACGNNVPQEYVLSLKNELKTRLCKNNIKKIKTVYIGGGTPSLLSVTQLSEILDTVKKYVHFEEDCEITLEVNPDDISKSFLNEINKLGITRLSVGIQSLSDKVLNFAGRRANSDCNIKALDCIKENWSGIFSIDLICALPYETMQSFENGLYTICKYNPEHISLYSLTIEDETPFGIMYNNLEFDYDWDDADLMWLKGREILKKNGYIQYEVSNFCKKGYECVHNLTYWNHEDYIGVGAGGTGTIYPQRWTNCLDLDKYIGFWGNSFDEVNVQKSQIPEQKEIIESDTSEFEFFMMGLRKLSGIKESDYVRLFNKKIPERIEQMFEKWQKNGLANVVCVDNDKIFMLNEKGILFLNKFLQEI